MEDIELKKEFYMQKKNADDIYFAAIDHQKEKHKPYKLLIGNSPKKEALKEYQLTNQFFEAQVQQGTKTLQNMHKNTNSYQNTYSRPPSSVGGTVINQFVNPNYYRPTSQENKQYTSY